MTKLTLLQVLRAELIWTRVLIIRRLRAIRDFLRGRP